MFADALYERRNSCSYPRHDTGGVQYSTYLQKVSIKPRARSPRNRWGLTVSGEGTGEGENKLCLIPEVETEVPIVFTSNERKLAAEFL